MSLPEPSLHILLINEHPEEIKLVTTSLRSFFPGCRIEAGYSSEDAVTFSQQGDWHIILIDQELAPERGIEVLARLRRHAPYAAILLQTNEHDSHTAIQALQNGADFLLFKQSPSFITELLFSVQEAVEKRDLQMKLDHTFQRHLRLIETLSDLLYELDAEGRFVYVSPTVTTMLGYSPDELAGRHYSMLLAPYQEQVGRFRLNERRAGSRSTRKLELTLHRKPLPDASASAVTVELTAKGLFDSTNRYLGTVGLLHDLSQEKAQQDRLTELESRLQETDRQLTLTREAARVSRQLQQPLTTLLHDSQRLLTSIQHSRIEHHVETMIAKASQASQLSHQLAQVMYATPAEFIPLNLNDVLQAVAQAVQPTQGGVGISLTCDFGRQVPAILGSRADIEHLAQILLEYARHCTSHSLAQAPLHLETSRVDLVGTSTPQSINRADVASTQPYAAFTIRSTAAGPALQLNDPESDKLAADKLLQGHRIVQAHGGSIQIEHAQGLGLSISIRLPATAEPAHGVPLSALSDSPQLTMPLTGIRRQNQSRPSDRAQPERRRSERKPFSLPVQLSIRGSALRGVLRNMSTGGALLTIRDISASIHLQPAYIVIKTPVSFLELQGTVHERPADAADLPLPAVREFVIAFSLTVEHERNVLRSLLEGLHDGSTTITFEGLILPAATAAEATRSALLSSPEQASERRETSRFTLIRTIQLIAPHDPTHRHSGQLLNLSLDGACLEPPQDFDTTENQQVLHLLPIEPSPLSPDAPGQHESREPWAARIIWNHPPQGSTGQTSRSYARIGVRFDHLSPAQEHQLRMIVARQSNHVQAHVPLSTDSPIMTESHSVQSHNGHRLALSIDSARGATTKQTPLIVLSPGYGTTQHSYLSVAYALAGTGLRVLRYDHSRHIGLSDGDPSHTAFTSLEDDLDAVLAFAHTHWPESPITLLASDLVGRVALRREDWQRRLQRLILLNPTLDLRSSLQALHQRDLVQEHLAGTRLGLGNLLGIPLDIDHFLADAVAAQYTDLEPLYSELSHCSTDVVMLTPGESTWDSSFPESPSSVLNEAMDRLGPRARRIRLSLPAAPTGGFAPAVLSANSRQLALLCQVGRTPQESAIAPTPALARITSTRARVEADRLRIKYSLGRAGRERLWNTYSDLTRTLDELPAHWHAMDQMYQLLQPLNGNGRLLDVGCGLHSFARLLLFNLSYRLHAQTWHPGEPLRYVGVDFSPSALDRAKEATGTAIQQVAKLFSGRISGTSPVDRQWTLSRSVDALPFADHSFDRIVAPLALSFAQSPLHALRELFRVLKPGGRLVVSAFTPSADVARLYRASLPELNLSAFTGETRLTLNRMAQTCVALRTEQLHGLEEPILSHYVSQLTPLPPKLLRTLSNHLILAAAEKPDSAG